MDLTPPQLKIAKWVAGLALASTVLLLASSALYFSGVTQGENNITVQWQKEKLSHAEEISKLRGEIQQKEFGHRQESARIADQLRKTEVQYEKAISDLSAERAQRLRLSVERAAIYERNAASGPAQCRALASHAAQLDRSLEEGRSVVAELRSALGQRDEQLRLLGAQLTTDRQLLDTH